MRSVIMLFLFCQLAFATPVKFRIVDETGESVKGVLVVVQNLDNHEAELLRALSDTKGNVDGHELRPGVYRLIATTPYGLWRTTIKEFIVKSASLELVIRLKPVPTHGYGDTVVVGTSWVDLQILRADGQAAADAKLLVRDKDATLYTERWYKADAQGRIKIEMISVPLVLVILYQDSIMTTELSQGNAPKALKFSPD
jgi:hypothetical protein